MTERGTGDTKPEGKVSWKLVAYTTLTLLLIEIVAVVLYDPIRVVHQYELWRFSRGLTVGMRRTEVIKRLGTPPHIAHSRAEFEGPDQYAFVPTCPVEKEVLEYYVVDYKVYVYIGRNDRVTGVFVSHS